MLLMLFFVYCLYIYIYRMIEIFLIVEQSVKTGSWGGTPSIDSKCSDTSDRLGEHPEQYVYTNATAFHFALSDTDDMRSTLQDMIENETIRLNHFGWLLQFSLPICSGHFSIATGAHESTAFPFTFLFTSVRRLPGNSSFTHLLVAAEAASIWQTLLVISHFLIFLPTQTQHASCVQTKSRANGFTHIPKEIENDKCLARRCQKLKLIHHASIHPLHIGEFSFSPTHGQLWRNHVFCRCGCLPWRLGRGVKFIGIWILNPL